jgi:hypothetical protein
MKTKVGHDWYQSRALSLLLGAYTFIYLLQGHHPVKQIKSVWACKGYTDKLWKMNVARDANSEYGELILPISSIPVSKFVVTATYLFLLHRYQQLKIFTVVTDFYQVANVRYEVIAGRQFLLWLL